MPILVCKKNKDQIGVQKGKVPIKIREKSQVSKTIQEEKYQVW